MNNYNKKQIELINNITDIELKEFCKVNANILMLPIIVNNGADVFSALQCRWKQFYKLIENTEWLCYSIKDIKKYGKLIIDAVKQYFSGNHLQANKIIKNLLKCYITNKCIVSSLKDIYIDVEANNWFRARKCNYGSLTKKDMNHIPFNRRGLVSNQRYSINGIPCLYLGTSIYACWEELNRPVSDDFWVNRYWVKHPNLIRVLNLSTTLHMIANYSERINSKNFNRSEFILDFFNAWIIQSACSVVVKETNRNFVEEYIVPQMIMQNIKDYGIDGILYFSVKIKNAYINDYGWISRNLAIPAFDEGKKAEYSKKIEELFLMSSPINLGMYNSGIISKAKYDNQIDFNYARTNAKIPITDEIFDTYDKTIFFQAELELIQDKYHLLPI